MEISELAKSFHEAKTDLSVQEKDLVLIEKLVEDLLKDTQTPDLKLEISGLNRQIKSQNESIEVRKTEVDGLQEELLHEIQSGKYDAEQKIEVALNESSYFEVWKTKKDTLGYSAPLNRN